MGRVALLLHYKVKPLLVFDGGALPAKAAQEASRRGKREHAKAMASQKAREDSHEEARKWYAKCVDVTPVMAKQLVDACAARWGDRVDFLVAPYEADAQLAQLARSGEAAAIVSEDSDNLAYGVPRVLFKLDADGSAQQVVLADLFAAGPGVNALDVRGWTQDMFVTMCALAGCDYVEAVKGVGIKNAHRLVARYKDRKKVLRALRYECAACPDDYEQRVDRAALTFGHQMRSLAKATELLPQRNTMESYLPPPKPAAPRPRPAAPPPRPPTPPPPPPPKTGEKSTHFFEDPPAPRIFRPFVPPAKLAANGAGRSPPRLRAPNRVAPSPDKENPGPRKKPRAAPSTSTPSPSGSAPPSPGADDDAPAAAPRRRPRPSRAASAMTGPRRRRRARRSGSRALARLPPRSGPDDFTRPTTSIMMLPLLAVGGVAAAVAYVLSRRRSGKKEPPLYDVNDFDGLEGGGGSPSHGSGRHRRHVHQSTPFDYEPRPQTYAARPASIPRGLRHPNVCLFMGASFEAGAAHYAIVTEYVAAGSLWDALADGPRGASSLSASRGGVALAVAVVHERLRPTLPPDADPVLAKLARACWAHDPGDRPPIAAALAELEAARP
ncbi:5'-3' exodeoxyribonuclease [Aureococcus anophagefferens]|nr:5'-3' exodeoxyribonuclease [Aureococcus anophagefferens]